MPANRTKLILLSDQELDGDQVDRDNFPLPNLGQRFENASKDIYEGKGFVIVRGLDPEAYSAEDFTIVYLGVSSYIAETRGKQDQRGSMLSEYWRSSMMHRVLMMDFSACD